MHLTRRAIGLLKNQYKSVLKKCFLINAGLLAFSGVAKATTVTTYDELLDSLSDANADVVLNMSGAGIDLAGGNGFAIGADQKVALENIGTAGDSSWTNTAYNINNSGTLSIDGVIFKQNETVTTGVSYVGGVIKNNASGHISQIINSVFEQNRAETTTTDLWGGIVNNSGEIDLIQNVTFKDSYAYAGKYAPHGGTFLNQGHIGLMDNVVFENNVMTGAPDMIGGGHGAALDNNDAGTIDKITNSVFRNNYSYRTGEAVLSGNYHASGGAMDNYKYIGEISNTLFEGNHTSTESPSARTNGGAVSNVHALVGEEYGKIDKIENVQFINNYTYAKAAATHGGALDSGSATGVAGNAYIGSLKNVLFQGNHVQSDGSNASGGAAILDGYVGSIEGTFEDNYAYSTGGYASGGATELMGKIGSIEGNFCNNYAYSTGSFVTGGAIYIGSKSDIDSLKGEFVGNYSKSTADYASGGAVNTNRATIGLIAGEFKNNYAQSTASFANGGALLFVGASSRYSVTNSITGQFLGNYTDAVGNASGGAINNNSYTSITNGISASFEGNHVQSNGASGLARGGAVINHGYIQNIIGNFKSNYAFSSGTGAIGGAVADMYGNISSLGIDELRGAYEGNYAEATGTGYAQGGAIYNGANAKLNLINASEFKGNYVKSGSNSETNGGAVWNAGSLVFGGENVFKGNYKEVAGVKSYNDIYNSGTITFNADSKTTLSGSFEGTNGTVNIGNAAELNLGNKLSGQRVSFVNAAKVNLGSYEPEGEAKSYGDLDLISFTSGSGKVELNAMNDEFQALKFGDTSLGSALDYQLDVDAVSEKADTIEAKALAAGTVNISNIRFKDNFENVTGVIQVLKNTDMGTLLKLTLDPQFVHDYGEGVVVETIGADALTSGDIVWDGDYGTYTLTTTTTATFDVATTDTDDDSIGYVANIKKEKTYNPRENLSMINQNEDYGEKSFNFGSAEDVYMSAADIGETYGHLTINGVSEGKQRSTIDLNGYQGFKIGDGKFVEIKDSEITNTGSESVIAVSEGGKLSFENASLNKVSINNEGEISIDNNEIAAKEAYFGKESKLSLAVHSLDNHGLFGADHIEIEEGAELHAVLGQGIVGIGETADIELLRAKNSDFNNFADVFENNMYRFAKKDKNGWYTIRQVKTAEEVSREAGGTKTNQEAAAAWVDGPAFDSGSTVADGLAALAQDDGRGLNKELTAVAPNDAPVVQGVSGQIHDILLKRVSYELRNKESKGEGLSSGDEIKEVSTWMEGYGGAAKLAHRGDHYGFDTDSKGMIIGADKKIGSAIKVGGGMQYDETDVKGYRRKTEADTETIFAYGRYQPSKWYVNGLLSYSMSDYDEDKKVLGKKYQGRYSADVYSAQAVNGYEFENITPISGLKYYHIKRHGYADGLGQSVSGKDMDILTAVGGVHVVKEYEMPCGHSLRPEAYIGVSYDLISDRDNAVVGVANGTSYKVHGKRMARFGVETQMGLAVDLSDRLSANINYIGGYRKDFQDHTGLIGLKYSF